MGNANLRFLDWTNEDAEDIVHFNHHKELYYNAPGVGGHEETDRIVITVKQLNDILQVQNDIVAAKVLEILRKVIPRDTFGAAIEALGNQIVRVQP